MKPINLLFKLEKHYKHGDAHFSKHQGKAIMMPSETVYEKEKEDFTAQKIKFSIKDFFRFLQRICSHLL